MGIRVAIARVAANTAIGNQSITTPELEGYTPKAAIFICTAAITTATAAANARLSIGAASSASNLWCSTIQTADALADTDGDTRSSSGANVIIVITAGGTLDSRASLVSFIKGGATINWAVAPSAAFLVTAIFFAGEEVQAHAGIFAPGVTVGATVNVTAPGFPADAVLLAHNFETFDNSSQNDFQTSVGVAKTSGTIAQRCAAYFENDGDATSDENGQTVSNRAGAEVDSGGSVSWSIELGAHASGFASTLRVASAATDDVGYLALRTRGPQVAVSGVTSPTGTGDFSIATGFRPQAAIILLTAYATDDVSNSGAAAAGAFGISSFTKDGAAFCNSWAAQNGVATTNTQSLSSAKAVDFANHAGTIIYSGTLASTDPTRYTLNFTTVSTARRWSSLAFEIRDDPAASLLC